jgi:hypothetical protein
MKNIHTLPTDKPSRLYKQTGVLVLDKLFEISNDGISINQHIYITSNEEIKVWDWVIEFQKGDDIGEVHFINSEYVIAGDIQKKIILTTNQDLINDGVQSIDDEFLEWFVKNPSCEQVDVFYKDVYSLSTWDRRYKIIIPQEEPKQLTELEVAIKLEEIEREEAKLNTCDIIFERAALIDIEENKQENTGKEFYESADAVITVYRQETIKKAAKSYRSSTANKMAIEQQAFQEGAKWQAERMYSEEEVKDLILKFNNDKPGIYDASEWFEQYKKK